MGNRDLLINTSMKIYHTKTINDFQIQTRKVYENYCVTVTVALRTGSFKCIYNDANLFSLGMLTFNSVF